MYIEYTMKRFNFYLTENQINQLKTLSKKTGLKKSELVRRAIDDYLEKKDK